MTGGYVPASPSDGVREERRTRTPSRASYSAGVAASLVAETVFIAMMITVSWIRGMDPWMVTRVPASFLLGPHAVQPPGFVAGDVLLGVLMHLMMAVVVGLIYAALLPGLGLSPVAGGLITGTVLFVLGFWVLPLLFPVWLAPFWLPPLEQAIDAAAHLVYGAVFGLAFQRLRAQVR